MSENIYSFYSSLLLNNVIDNFENDFYSFAEERTVKRNGKEVKGLFYCDSSGPIARFLTLTEYLQSISSFQSSQLLNKIEEAIEKISIADRLQFLEEVNNKLTRYKERIKSADHLKKYDWFQMDFEKTTNFFIKTFITPHPNTEETHEIKKRLKWYGDDKSLCTLFMAINYDDLKSDKFFIQETVDGLTAFLVDNFVRKDGKPFEIDTIKTYIRKKDIASRNNAIDAIEAVFKNWKRKP